MAATRRTLDFPFDRLHSLRMERLGLYLFCAMFIGVGLLASAWMLLFYPGDSRWLVGPAFVAAGIVGIFIGRASKKADVRRKKMLAEADGGQATVTAVEKSMRSSGGENWRGLWLTLSVEVPGRPPFESRAHVSVPPENVKTMAPGLVLQVKVHPSKPTEVIIPRSYWLQP